MSDGDEVMQISGLVAQAIERAITAGACWRASRKHNAKAAGWRVVARAESDAATALLNAFITVQVNSPRQGAGGS